MSNEKNTIQPITWIFISGAVFVVFILLAAFLGTFGTALNRLKPSTYFFLLIPLALMAAGFLFGAMRSQAKYNGKAYGGTLELGGPVVLLVIIIYFGYKFRPTEESSPFSLSLNVFGKKENHEIVPNGELTLFYGSANPRLQIHEGQAVLQEISPAFRGKELRILPQVEGYSRMEIIDSIPLSANSLNVYLERIPDSVTVSGVVRNGKGQPVHGAVLVFADGMVKDSTDRYGNFRITLPFKDGTETTLRVYSAGKLSYDNLVNLSAKVSMNIPLQ